MHKLRVGIIRGGQSSNYDTSIISGGEVLRELPKEYNGCDIVIDKSGQWYSQGVVVAPGEILKKLDVVFNALHAEHGEDGKIQQTLESVHIPYTGSQISPSFFAFNKEISKKLFGQHGIKTPRYMVVKDNAHLEEEVLTIFKVLGFPVIIKPLTGSRSRGIYVAHNFHELGDMLKQAQEEHSQVIVEEFIQGQEATCGVIESFRDQKFYTFIPTMIKKARSYFSSEEKKNGDYGYSHHGISHEEKKTIQEMTQKAHEILGLRHYSQCDFIVHPKRGVFLIEVNSHPTLTPNCLFPKKLEAVGIPFSQFIDHTIKLAFNNK